VGNKTLRSIGAVMAGMVADIILSIGTDVSLNKVGIYPALGQPMGGNLLLLATVYRSVFGAVAGYITAWLAPDRPMQHALAGGAVGLVLASVGAAVTWNHLPSLEPHWYPVTLIVLAMPCAWLGGILHGKWRGGE
jgi:hypothetical protein